MTVYMLPKECRTKYKPSSSDSFISESEKDGPNFTGEKFDDKNVIEEYKCV
jgi:hypothetical protein